MFVVGGCSRQDIVKPVGPHMPLGETFATAKNTFAGTIGHDFALELVWWRRNMSCTGLP